MTHRTLSLQVVGSFHNSDYSAFSLDLSLDKLIFQFVFCTQTVKVREQAFYDAQTGENDFLCLRR